MAPTREPTHRGMSAEARRHGEHWSQLDDISSRSVPSSRMDVIRNRVIRFVMLVTHRIPPSSDHCHGGTVWPRLLMKTLIPLIELNALPKGRGRHVCAAGFDLAVFRIGDDVYAIDDSCPHQGGSLSNGKLQGPRVTCPVHGLKFDLKPGRPGAAATLEVRNYTVSTVDGMVMLDPGS